LINNSRQIKSVFISDLHLGTSMCKSKEILEFLKFVDKSDVQNLFLVGDIIDMWKLKRGFSWSKEHNTIIQKILRMARKGVNVVYITGNHDEYFREFENLSFGDIKVLDSLDYETTSGKYLIIHGDQYDFFLLEHKYLGHIGSWAYDGLVAINTIIHSIRTRLGFSYWYLSAYFKTHAKQITNVVDTFENRLVKDAYDKGYAGVICGHIHVPKIIKGNNTATYINCGDWTDHCSAILEYNNGDFEIWQK